MIIFALTNLQARVFQLVFFLVCFFLLTHFQAFGQKFKISGTVQDASNQEYMSFVRILVQDTSLGVETNSEGYFQFNLPKGRYVFKINYLGYKEKLDTVIVTGNAQPDLNIQLKPIDYQTEVVTIRSKDNFADAVIRNVQKNKKFNNMDRFQNYQVETYNKLVISLDNITGKNMNSLALRPIRSFLRAYKGDSAIADSSKETYKLAVFLNETITDKFYDRPNVREIVKAQNKTGEQGPNSYGSEINFFSSTVLEINIYDNIMEVMGKQFISPVAYGSFMNYNYYWNGTDTVDNDTIYRIELHPKSEFDAAFHGVLFICRRDWSIRRADLTMTKHALINFVEGVRIRQHFANVPGHERPVITSSEAFIDFKNGANKVGIFGKSATYYSDYKFNVKFKKDFFDEGQVSIEKNSVKTDTNFWKTNRKSALDRSEEMGYVLYDSLMKKFWWNYFLEAIDIITVGMKKYKYFNLGPYMQLISQNKVEGIRFRVGIYTNANFSKRWYIGQHLAYGIRDDKFKYDTNIRFKLLDRPRLEIGAASSYEMEQAGFPNFLREGSGAFNTLVLRFPFQQLNYYREQKLNLYIEPTKSITLNLFGRNKSIDPTFPMAYLGENGELYSKYTISEIGMSMRLGIKEKFIMKGGERVYVTNRSPKFFVDAIIGTKGVFGSHFNYKQTAFTITQNVKFGRFGTMYYTASIGKIWGNLPYPSLYVFQGSQSYIMNPQGVNVGGLSSLVGNRNRTLLYDPVGFNLMYYYEFIADEYLVVGFDHHLEGWLLKKIPLIRRLKVKEIITGRLAWGRLSAANRAMNQPGADLFGITLNAPDLVPYMEMGFGIDNIFKFFRFDFIWRLNYHNPPAKGILANYNYNVGLRGNISISF